VSVPTLQARAARWAPPVHVEHCMGTVFSFRIADPSVPVQALERAVRRLHEIDATFSTYRPDSQISRIAAGTLRPEDADPEVGEVLAACERMEQLTDGWFSARPDGTRLDPSGYVKGWAIGQAEQELVAAGAQNLCVNGGGDVICRGGPTPGQGWRIGIADPHVPGQLIETVQTAGRTTGQATGQATGQPAGVQAVATSGTAERGHHVLDPHDGRPATGTAAVTVLADDIVTADVYATAALAMGPRRGADWLAAQPGVRALLVKADGRRVRVG